MLKQLKQVPIWKTVTVGVHKTPEAYCQALIEAGFNISGTTVAVLSKASCVQQEEELDLVVLTPSELGFLPSRPPFMSGADYQDICARAEGVGLAICPPDVGPALRLMYRNDGSEKYQYLDIGMKSLGGWGSERALGRFQLFNDHLTTTNGHPEHFCNLETHFVFVGPRK